MDLSIIIVSWNVCSDVIQCIQSIYDNPPSGSYEIILVDNHSSDKTVSHVRELYSNVLLIENNQNLGFAAANNQGIKHARGQYLCFLNPDTLILPECFDKMLAFMESQQNLGLCGPQILNPDKSIQRSVRRFPNYRGMFYRFTLCRYLGLFRNQSRFWKMKDFNHLSQLEVDQLIGAALFSNRSVINKIGGFDEQFFMYYEEVDLCLRAKKAGYRIMFYPEPQVIHFGGQSAKQIPAKVKYMMLKSLILYMKKQHSTLFNLFVLFVFKLCLLISQLTELMFSVLCCLIFLPFPKMTKKNYMKFKSCALFLFKYYMLILFT